MRTCFFALLLVIVFGACTKPKDFEYRDIRNIKMNSLGFEKTTLSFELVYYNPNQFGVDLRKVDSEVFLDSIFLGKFMLDTIMHIPRMSEFSLPSSIDLDMRNLMKNSAVLLFKKDVLIQAKGTVKVGKGGFFTTVPFLYESRQALSLF